MSFVRIIYYDRKNYIYDQIFLCATSTGFTVSLGSNLSIKQKDTNKVDHQLCLKTEDDVKTYLKLLIHLLKMDKQSDYLDVQMPVFPSIVIKADEWDNGVTEAIQLSLKATPIA